MKCKVASQDLENVLPHLLGVFCQNIFEKKKKKIKTFQKAFHWLKRSLRTEEEDSKAEEYESCTELCLNVKAYKAMSTRAYSSRN